MWRLPNLSNVSSQGNNQNKHCDETNTGDINSHPELKIEKKNLVKLRQTSDSDPQMKVLG